MDRERRKQHPAAAMMTGKRHFLFLQGNATPFYRRLGKYLAEAGHQVSRINPGGGDYLFWGSWNAINWRGTPEELAWEMPSLIQQIGPTDLILFGDCRPIHRAAIETAKRSGVRVNVFEEGYFRPHWITLERDGVNGYSKLPRDPQWYLEKAKYLPPLPPVQPVGGGLRNRILFDFAWQAANYAFWPKFPNFRTHRPYPITAEYAAWLKRLAKLRVNQQEAELLQSKLVKHGTRYFLFPLQLDSDMQVRVHSRWGRMLPIIEFVIDSFARTAPQNLSLVIKNHPLDNGMIDYRGIITAAAQRYNIRDRLYFIDGGNLEYLASNAEGVVTVNSTAAMVGLEKGIPTIAIGNAIFALPNLTFQGGLDAFWSISKATAAPSPTLQNAFAKVVKSLTQINANFYTKVGVDLALKHCVSKLIGADNFEPVQHELLHDTAD